jgi:hypothetical protein
MTKFIAAHDAWRDQMDNLEKNKKPPREPVYRGPTEWELSLAEKRVSVRKWQLELRHAKFQGKHQIETTQAWPGLTAPPVPAHPFGRSVEHPG